MTEQKYYEHSPGQRFFGDERYPNFSIPEYLKELDIDYKQHDSDAHIEYAINCPECVNRGEERLDTKYRLWINQKTTLFHCYNCEWSGLITTLIRRLSNISFERAIKILNGKSLDPLDHLNLLLFEEHMEPDEPEFNLKEIEFPYGYEPITSPNSYLELRGIPLSYAKEHDWGYCKVGYCKERLIVPTYMENRLVFWQARATWDEPRNKNFKKVLNPQGVAAKPILYQYDSAKEYKTIIVAEGFTDAAKIGPDAVATNGKRLHSAQVEWLEAIRAEKIILMYDRGAFKPGRKKDGVSTPSSAARAIEMLKTIARVYVAVLPDNRDPGDYSFHSSQLRSFIQHAKIAA